MLIKLGFNEKLPYEQWILREFLSLVKRPSTYNKVFYSDVTNKIDNFTFVIIHQKSRMLSKLEDVS